MDLVSAATLDPDTRVGLVGGKGAALARMLALGLPVPPGFTLTTDACHTFLADGWTDELDAAVSDGIHQLETVTGKRFGDPVKPLLVSVRSGAPISMPGMMDTVLNVGMSTDIAESLGAATGDARFGWDTYRRFIHSYAAVVLEAPAEELRLVAETHLGPDGGQHLEPAALADAVRLFAASLADRGFSVPIDSGIQVRAATRAVFASWRCERAHVYRQVEGISHDLGTAATVQMMAFGNLGERSGTGVAFSRDPSTGEPGMVGDFLQGAQGEDVVAGTHRPRPVSALRDVWPNVFEELERTVVLLERDLADIADIEFTVERGEFWLLQVRRGKHSHLAALRIAVDMAEDSDFPLTRTEALNRVAPILADPPMLSTAAPTGHVAEVLASGLAASPGRATGEVCIDIGAAVAAEAQGRNIILFRRETSPADVAGMAASRGIVTSLGGLVSHAAVVARGWQLPAVVGAAEIELSDGGIRIGGRLITAGTVVTVDGSTGQVFLGTHHVDEVEVPEVAILRSWQRKSDGIGAGGSSVTSEGFREPANPETVARVLAIKGMGSAEAIALVLGAESADVALVLDELIAAGDVQELRADSVRPMPPLTERVNGWFDAEAARLHHVVEPQLQAFHPLNAAFKVVVTDWQLRTLGGQQVPNDHTDADWDANVIKRLRNEIHLTVEPIIAAIATHEPRIGRYGSRLEAALVAVEDGDRQMVAHPLKDSYHTVWFELHEELIRLAGRNRLDETKAGRA